MSILSNVFSCSNLLNFYFCLLVLLMTEYSILKSAMIMDLIFMGNGVNLCRLY